MTSTTAGPAVAALVLIVATSLNSTAYCQTTTLSADTAVGVSAIEGPFGPPPSYQGFPAGTPLTATHSLRAAAGAAWASLTIQKSPLGMRLQEQGRARRNPTNPFASSSAGTARAMPGVESHSVLWNLVGAGVGRIDVVLTGSISEPFTVFALVEVDVGADGSKEIVASMVPTGNNVRTSIPVRFLSDLPVRITAHAHASASSLNHNPDYGFDLDSQYVPQVGGATISSYGSGCGPLLSGTDTPSGLLHRLRFVMTGGLPSAYSAFVFGTTRTSTPLLGTSCLLLTDPVAIVFGPTTSAGEATFTIVVPGPIPVVAVRVQAVSFDFTPRVASTQGLVVTIRD